VKEILTISKFTYFDTYLAGVVISVFVIQPALKNDTKHALTPIFYANVNQSRTD
jgi:hypothetical protein